ncbi:MAG TPA: hypothetical protein VJK04_04200 [Candidatus Paceibacterota bacterium]
MLTKKIKNDSMIDLKWALMCKNASVDKQSNIISLLSVIEEITINKNSFGSSVSKEKNLTNFSDKTQIKGDFTLVVQLERRLDVNIPKFEPNIEIKIIDPNKEALATNILPLYFEENRGKLRAIISFDSLIVKDSGIYDFLISIRVTPQESFIEKGKVSVEVKILD